MFSVIIVSIKDIAMFIVRPSTVIIKLVNIFNCLEYD
jgi:hypothetical protein